MRATITPETVARQADIVAYLHESLGATHMRFEPVYGVRGTLTPRFRPEERHGPHCDVLQDALHVLPDGTLTACFFPCEGAEPWRVGRWDGRAWQLDYERIAAHRRKVTEISARCRDCIAVFHYARECPERCGVIDDLAAHAPGFRCLVNRLLAERRILTDS